MPIESAAGLLQSALSLLIVAFAVGPIVRAALIVLIMIALQIFVHTSPFLLNYHLNGAKIISSYLSIVKIIIKRYGK